MARTLKIEMTEKQYAALVTRAQRAEAPSPEAYLAILPIIHGEAEAIERIEVHEDACSIYTANSHAKATAHAIFGPAARSPIRPSALTSPASPAS